MKESSIVRLLRAPDIELVDFAIRRANLTWKEALAVDLCGRRGYTQESAAEHAGYSVDAMQKWYRSGIAKGNRGRALPEIRYAVRRQQGQGNYLSSVFNSRSR